MEYSKRDCKGEQVKKTGGCPKIGQPPACIGHTYLSYRIFPQGKTTYLCKLWAIPLSSSGRTVRNS